MIYGFINLRKGYWLPGVKAGYGYLLYYAAGANFLQNEDERFKTLDWLALEKMLGSLTAIKTFGDAYTLYSLNP